jgi:hypothetical protein
MKRNFKTLTIAAFLVMAPVFMFAQPHPNGGAAPTGSNQPVGPSAPIGSGTLILMVLAAAYAGKKVYEMRSSAIAE